MSTSFFQDMLGEIAERGRSLLERSAVVPAISRVGWRSPAKGASIDELSRALLSGRGEASGVAIARQVLDLYAALSPEERTAFFRLLARDFAPSPERLRAAWAQYDADPSPAHLQALLRAVEPPRQELFRRLNLAPGGTRALVAMREKLLEEVGREEEFASVADDLEHLFHSWFNRGFLMMQRITWSTPADILERIIRYEAVHTIHGWDELRRRVQPPDRRCYAFFHPSLVDEPLIFVEVALTREIPHSIQEVLADGREPLAPERATTAVFYSISNCQPGLRGISFGNFLIKQVVEDLCRDIPSLKTFVTLSPIPGFGRWLSRVAEDPEGAGFPGFDRGRLAGLDEPDWHLDPVRTAELKPVMLGLAAAYFLRMKNGKGQPLDPVARFHLGNGARLERINWLGDTSPKGMREGAGLMVNYLYDLGTIEAHHEAYANQGVVAASGPVQRQLRDFEAGLLEGRVAV
ncbi:malonyl-CoA decarboxylase domain-containing protein [Enterovirga aerilata]|uniref:Malonyl-CoA decarboxylase n=1 Tax=Enterovirga aerilata TaxID=2730920 RepID=A0A849I4R4_9HYPH|nr:malonyl-CoA decarboxylase family protein [Enterovirga sp. DB1703]NNM74826.1 malonyl-CoA decarboxylase [Enterovirga sp. DB1703]